VHSRPPGDAHQVRRLARVSFTSFTFRLLRGEDGQGSSVTITGGDRDCVPSNVEHMQRGPSSRHNHLPQQFWSRYAENLWALEILVWAK